MYRLLLITCLILAACSQDSSIVANEQLSAVLSIGNLVKREIADPADSQSVVGLVVDVDLVNTGLIPIEDPFNVTWTLLDPDGNRFAASSRRVSRMSANQTLHLTFALSFASVPDLVGYQDGVTFDYVAPPG